MMISFIRPHFRAAQSQTLTGFFLPFSQFSLFLQLSFPGDEHTSVRFQPWLRALIIGVERPRIQNEELYHRIQKLNTVHDHILIHIHTICTI